MLLRVRMHTGSLVEGLKEQAKVLEQQVVQQRRARQEVEQQVG